jgi:hypothetical protein
MEFKMAALYILLAIITTTILALAWLVWWGPKWASALKKKRHRDKKRIKAKALAGSHA